MYATLVNVRIAAGQDVEARQGLRDQVLPRVKASPGFVAGYWLAPDGDRGTSMVIWDSREAAEAAMSQLQPGAHPAPPITVETVELREVIANI